MGISHLRSLITSLIEANVVSSGEREVRVGMISSYPD